MMQIKINNMKIYITENYEEMSKQGAYIFSSQVRLNPTGNYGLATGSTPVGMYLELIRMNKEEKLDFSQASTFNLDEYYPIKKSNEQSYDYFMKQNLFNHINIPQEQINIPNGMAEDIEEECKSYDEKIIAAGGIDLQLLGIGSNGHIGFNEPSNKFEPATHKVQLDQKTIKDNSRFFDSIDEVPTQAVSMGIQTIMSARKILLLANGKGKAEVVKEMITGKIDPHVPASILQLHNDVTIVLDEEAASELLRIYDCSECA